MTELEKNERAQLRGLGKLGEKKIELKAYLECRLNKNEKSTNANFDKYIYNFNICIFLGNFLGFQIRTFSLICI